jgi:NifU-like protein involved in Fe-S cluster formation
MWIFGWEENIILQEYSKNPVNNFEIDKYTVKHHEWNFICWDDITVFLLIEEWNITNYSYTGNLSTVSIAVAGFLSEFIMESKIKDILSRDYNFINEKWIVVSNKRKRASILPILAIRNAIHKYMDDWIVDDFDDIIND